MRIVVGFVVSDKKLRHLTDRGFFNPSSDSVEYVAVTSGENLDRFDLVISKIHSEIDPDFFAQIEGNPRHAAPFRVQKLFQDRYAMIQTMWKGSKAQSPDSALISAGDWDIVSAFLLEHERVILKPRAACGTPDSHDLCIASSLLEVKWFIEKRSGEFILQQFVDHDETFFKIFVIGSNISIFRRKSIGSNSAQFNSQGGVFSESLDGLGDITRAQQSELELIATEITSMFSTSLLGIDVVRGNSRFFVVDINYFPSYNELGPMFRTLMDRYCRELVRLS